MARRLIYSEKKGSTGAAASYLYVDAASAFRPLREEGGHVGGLQERVLGWARDVFLPQGFPESVSPDYLQYQFWDSVQAYCSSIAGALSLQSTLVGLGVGEGSATPLAATLSWLLKDGTGMVSSIAFAYWKGSQLDCNSKQWRLFADFTNNVNLALHLLGPFLPVPFLAVLCVSGVLTALVGVAGGSTRAALAVHQARCDNMADVSAKDGSQETLVNLAALLTNLTLLPYFTANLGVTWTTFLLCVFLHMYANYQAMRALTLHSLNRPRLLYVLGGWVKGAADSEGTADGGGDGDGVPSPAEANLNEPLLFGPAFKSDYFPLGFRVTIGHSLHWALRRCGGGGGGEAELFEAACDAFSGEQYMLCANLRHRQLHIIYRGHVTPEDELRAFVTTYLCVLNYSHLLEGTVLPPKFLAPNLPATTPTSTASEYQVMKAVRELGRQVFPSLMKSLQVQKWRIDKLHFGADEWRLIED